MEYKRNRALENIDRVEFSFDVLFARDHGE